jgi:hypothetical protein
MLFGQWYSSQALGGPNNATNYTPVAGDVFALPFEVTSGVTSWSQWCVENITSSVSTAVFFCIYDDRRYLGYPQNIYATAANTGGTPFPLAASAGVKQSPTSAGNGFLARVLVDPGLYWLVLKIVTAGTTTMRTMLGPSLFLPMLATTGAGGTKPVAWKLTGTGTTALPGFFPAGAAATDVAPMVGMLIG